MKEKKQISKWSNSLRCKKRGDFSTLLIKKPKFGIIFLKYFMVCLSVVIVMCLLGTLLAVSYYREVKKRDFYIETTAMQDSLKYAYNQVKNFPESEEDKEKLWKAYIRRNMNLTCSFDDYAAVIYDADTKEALVETKGVTNIMYVTDMYKENMHVYVYECPNEVMQDVMTEYDAKTQDADEQGWVTLVIEDLYVKGEEVIPGKMELIQESIDGKKVRLQEYDKTPEDTTGYKHIVANEVEEGRIMGPLMWKEEDLKDRKKVNAFLQEFVENKNPEESIWENKYNAAEEDFPWGGLYADCETVELGDGLNVKLVMAVQVNLFADYAGWIAQVYAGALLVSIILSLALAYRNYMTRMNHYQLDAYRRETTNAMAHDLKTPLMAISGYAQNLRENVHSEKKEYYADSILEHVQYMNEMIGNILELAKVENQTSEPKREVVNLKAVTEDVLKKYEILIPDKKLTVTLEGETVIQADSALMTRAVENLISNAIKYASPNTTIYIQMGKGYWKVRNTMEHEMEVPVEELFQPFVKGDNSRNHKGTGIGLTIVKNIVKLHGFDISLQCKEKEFVAEIKKMVTV